MSDNARRNLDQVFLCVNKKLQKALGIPQPAPDKSNKYIRYWNEISVFKDHFLLTTGFRKFMEFESTEWTIVPSKRLDESQLKESSLLFGRGGVDTNVIGTKNVVDAAIKAGVEKFCFLSSIAACGKPARSEMIDEESGWVETAIHSSYSHSKYLSEQEVWKGIAQGLNAVIVNPGVILGVSGTETGSSQLFSQVRKGLMFYTNGGTGYVDVRDVVKAMILLTNSEVSAQRFVLVAENCCNKDVLSWMADGFGKRRPFIGVGKNTLWFVGVVSEVFGKFLHFEPLIDRGTARMATNREYYSSRKILETIGFQFTPIEKSIKEICEFQNKTLIGSK